jgi:hypothetical protein
MLSNEINRVRVRLGELAGQVGPEQWELISACRRDLEGSEQYAQALETALAPLGTVITFPAILSFGGKYGQGDSANH